jgi:hypothetical protein
MTEEVCAICGKKADMDFTCILPGPGSMPDKVFLFKDFICLECYGDCPSDMDVALKVLFDRYKDDDEGLRKWLSEHEMGKGEPSG